MPVFWRPDAVASLVRLVPAHDGDKLALRFEPERWARDVASHQDEDGLHLILGSGRREVRLWLPRPVAPGAPVMAELDLDPWFYDRSETAWRMMRLARGGRKQAPAGPDPPVRVLEALRAYDGRQAGAAYREIAEVLFGPDRVAGLAWQTSALRAAVVRLAEMGQRLVAGGYRELLKPPRPSGR
jgi:hypothetical protein